MTRARGVSVLHCLAVGMVGEGVAGTGTVMRPDTVRRYSEEAGFGTFELLPIENDFYRFYRLVPWARPAPDDALTGRSASPSIGAL